MEAKRTCGPPIRRGVGGRPQCAHLPAERSPPGEVGFRTHRTCPAVPCPRPLERSRGRFALRGRDIHPYQPARKCLIAWSCDPKGAMYNRVSSAFDRTGRASAGGSHDSRPEDPTRGVDGALIAGEVERGGRSCRAGTPRSHDCPGSRRPVELSELDASRAGTAGLVARRRVRATRRLVLGLPERHEHRRSETSPCPSALPADHRRARKMKMATRRKD